MIVNNYGLYTKKDISNTRLAVLSDIHNFQDNANDKDFELLCTLDRISPTAILLPGDLYNRSASNSYIGNFIDTASDIADVFYVPGNSEFKRDFIPTKIYFNNNPRFHILGDTEVETQNDIVHFNGMNIVGLKPDASFYEQSEERRVELLLTKYREYIYKLASLVKKEDFNIMLCHDPIIIAAAKELKALGQFDLVVSGHNHGGIAPKSLKPLLKILGLDLEKLYPTYTKGMFEVNDTKYLVSEGVTKYHSDMGPLAVLEKFHQGTIDVVDIKRIRKKHEKDVYFLN